PEELQELIEKHEEDASPPSEVSETNTIDEFEKLEEEAALIESNDAEGDEVSGDADDEISLATPRIDDGEKKHGIEEELVDGESVVEFNDGIDPGDENLNDAENNVETESLKSHQGSETQKIEIFGTQEKMYDDETERSQAEAPTFDNASDNEINDGGVLANFKTDKDIEDQFVADEDENISRPKINTSNNETDENEEETSKPEIIAQNDKKKYDDETERSQAEAPTFDNGSDNEINDGGVLANFKTDKDIEDQFVGDEDENISASEINTSNNETDKSEAETPKPEIIAQNDNKEMLEKTLDEIKGENKDEPDGAEDENISQNETARSNFSEKREENQKINEQEKTIIEFWHLATALASLLRLKVPEEGEIVDEHERRKTTLDKILEEMQKLLIQFRNDDALN
uniref:Uncharacterized protein n=1 Tax=Panagrolaimus sp. ES5 TaxID=591445 RepID=A0AC34FQX5_9BILA